MAIEYDLVPGPARRDEDGNEVRQLVPKVVTYNTITTAQLAHDISSACSFHEADVVGMLGAFTSIIATYLNSSCRVELDGLGTLSLGIACNKDKEGHTRVITSPSEVKPHQLHVAKVILEAKPEFMTRLQGEFVRSSQGFPSNARRELLDADARRAALLDYLSAHTTINIGQYAFLTGLSRKQASAELHALAAAPSADTAASVAAAPSADTAASDATAPLLKIIGSGTHILFILRSLVDPHS